MNLKAAFLILCMAGMPSIMWSDDVSLKPFINDCTLLDNDQKSVNAFIESAVITQDRLFLDVIISNYSDSVVFYKGFNDDDHITLWIDALNIGRISGSRTCRGLVAEGTNPIYVSLERCGQNSTLRQDSQRIVIPLDTLRKQCQISFKDKCELHNVSLTIAIYEFKDGGFSKMRDVDTGFVAVLEFEMSESDQSQP